MLALPKEVVAVAFAEVPGDFVFWTSTEVVPNGFGMLEPNTELSFMVILCLPFDLSRVEDERDGGMVG